MAQSRFGGYRAAMQHVEEPPVDPREDDDRAAEEVTEAPKQTRAPVEELFRSSCR